MVRAQTTTSNCYHLQASTILAINLYAFKLLALPKLRKKDKRKREKRKEKKEKKKKKDNLGSQIIEKGAT